MFNEKINKKILVEMLYSPAFLLISSIGIAFGYWFAINQVKAVVPTGLNTYPIGFFMLTIFKCYLTVIALYSLIRAILLHLSGEKLTSFKIAVSFLPLLLVNISLPIYWALSLIVFLQSIFLVVVLQKQDCQRLARRYLFDIIVLILFFVLHLFITSRFSFLHWNMSILTPDGYYTDESTVLAPIFRGFVLAKQFSFSFLDHSQWAGLMHTPFLINSPLMQMLAFVFDLPSASFESFHIVLMTLYFILIVAGSFGFYLFLKYAGQVHILFAIWGGVLFAFGGTPIIDNILGLDNGVFYSSYAVFPYALLLISLAIRKNSKTYALWAAVALAGQLFIYAPHPEGLLYSAMFYVLYGCGMVLFSEREKRQQYFHLLVLSVSVFVALTAFDVVPILYDRLMSNMYVIAHVADMKTVALKDIKLYMVVVIILLPISLLLQTIRNKLTPVYLSSVFLAASMLIFLSIGRYSFFMKLMAHLLHFGIHFTYYWRFGIYFCLSAFTVFIFTLDGITSLSCEWVANRYPRLFGKAH